MRGIKGAMKDDNVKKEQETTVLFVCKPRCLPKVGREEGYELGERLPRLPRLRSSISCPHLASSPIHERLDLSPMQSLFS